MARTTENDTAVPLRFFSRTAGPQITISLLTEVKAGFDQFVDHARYVMGLKHIAPKGSRQPPEYSNVANWLLAAILEMPLAQREELLRRGKASCDRRQQSAVPVYFAPEGGASLPEDVPGKAHSVEGRSRHLNTGKDGGKGEEVVPVVRKRPR